MADAERELGQLRAVNRRLLERVAALEKALGPTLDSVSPPVGGEAPLESSPRVAPADPGDPVATHRETARALREREALIRSIGSNLPTAMLYQIVRAPDGSRRFTYVSDAVLRLHGCTPEDVKAEPLLIYSQVYEEDQQRVYLEEEAAFRAFVPFSTQARFRMPDGAVRWSYFASAPRRLDDGSTCWDGIEVDITDRKRAEEERALLIEQLEQSRKMESLGRLAGGVAHDLNNLLTPILGYGEMLSDDFSKDDARRGDVEAITRAGQRARSLVHQLLAFSRKQALELRSVDLNKVVEDFGRLLRRTIREDVGIVYDLAPALPAVRADVVQIEQVLMNLSVNAQDAMPRGGRLTIQTTWESPDGGATSAPSRVVGGGNVLLTVTDTGGGMDAETRGHLFEPFYTTKSQTSGTGLGLATVYGIVTQHGGTVRVRSEPGQGATFTVSLPAAAQVPGEEDRVILRLPEAPAGSETILLVEDDEPVRTLAQAILRRQGYQVLAAANGAEALALLGQDAGSLDLLLTDVVMPGMNGMEVYRQARVSHPGLKALFMSGYATDVVAPHGVLGEGVHFLQKPFTGRLLAAKVREVLDGGRPGGGAVR
jgi:PAS domain S-box-containing protein